MANIQKRGDYRPRHQREREAYRLVLLGAGTGLAGVITLILAIVGVIGDPIPTIILLAIALWCVLRFRRVTGLR